jgi:hypothetical protein
MKEKEMGRVDGDLPVLMWRELPLMCLGNFKRFGLSRPD